MKFKEIMLTIIDQKKVPYAMYLNITVSIANMMQPPNERTE